MIADSVDRKPRGDERCGEPAEPPADPASLPPDQLQAEVDSRTWFHTIDLGRGVVTKGQKDTPDEEE